MDNHNKFFTPEPFYKQSEAKPFYRHSDPKKGKEYQHMLQEIKEKEKTVSSLKRLRRDIDKASSKMLEILRALD